MKIAMVFDGLGTGGIERVGASYAQLLVDMGHEVTVINLRSSCNEMRGSFPASCVFEEDTLPIAFQPDAFAALLKRPWGKYAFPAGYLASKALLQLKKLTVRVAQRARFDVAIAFSGHLNDLTYVAYGLVSANKKLAWLHGALEGYLLLSYGFAALYERIQNLCVLSTAGQDRALKDFPRLAERLRITHIYNPIRQDPASVREEDILDIRDGHDEVLVMVGRFGADKDQATVIRALGVLRQQRGSCPLLILVGDGPTRAFCEGLVRELDLEDVVRFVGNQSEVDPYLMAADIAVHSSPAEGLPTVVLEAMRDGVPVLATNSLPGVPEILGDSEYGLICKVGNPDDMAEKMRLLLDDPDLRASYAARGTERVRSFSPDAIGARLTEVLERAQ